MLMISSTRCSLCSKHGVWPTSSNPTQLRSCPSSLQKLSQWFGLNMWSTCTSIQTQCLPRMCRVQVRRRFIQVTKLTQYRICLSSTPPSVKQPWNLILCIWAVLACRYSSCPSSGPVACDNKLMLVADHFCDVVAYR